MQIFVGQADSERHPSRSPDKMQQDLFIFFSQFEILQNICCVVDESF